MADIKLNISTEKYQARINTLENYVKQLETLKSNYQASMREIPSIWKDSEADQYYNTVNTSIEKVQQAIDAANSNIAQLNNVINNLNTTSGNINSAVSEVTSVVDKLFN